MAMVCLSDYEKKAAERLPTSSWGYYRSGAGDEFTLKLNHTAYNRWRIRPRFLVNVQNRNTKCEVLGIELDFPIAIAPTAMQKMAHPEGECATAKAAERMNTIYTMSTLSTSSIEDVASAAPNANKWFQLYIYKDRDITKSLVRRAECHGFKAIVLTVDAPIFGLRRSDVRNRFQLPNHLKLANFADEKVLVQSGGGSGLNEYVNAQFDATLNWDDVKWLVNFTKLPVILKGIMTHEDAKLALYTGCKGIIVSNHGGRQIDTVSASIEALPEIVKAVGAQIPVMLDGGVRSGIDAFKALAIGAKLVFVGRPIIHGLAVNGQKGVEDILAILKNEFNSTMGLVGVTSVDQINKNYVIHESCYKFAKL